MVILAIMTHLGLLLKDKGFDVQTTGWIVTVYTATAMIFQLVGGYVGDRGPKNIALFIFTTIQAAAVVVLTLSSTRLMFYLFAVLFGMGFGGRNPLTTAIRGEYFGRASFGRILGLSTVPMNVLLLIGSPLAGYMRDHQGSLRYGLSAAGRAELSGRRPVPLRTQAHGQVGIDAPLVMKYVGAGFETRPLHTSALRQAQDERGLLRSTLTDRAYLLLADFRCSVSPAARWGWSVHRRPRRSPQSWRGCPA